MGRDILSRSLIQFSVDGWSCVPSLLLTCGQTMVEVMKIMMTSLKDPRHVLLKPMPPTLQHATTDPHSSWKLPDTLRQVSCWVTVPGSWCTRFFVPAKSLFSQSCLSSGCSMVGLMATSSKMAYAIPRLAVPRAPASVAGHC